jgi:hypothetical protein
MNRMSAEERDVSDLGRAQQEREMPICFANSRSLGVSRASYLFGITGRVQMREISASISASTRRNSVLI